jgi:hypothetical protein
MSSVQRARIAKTLLFFHDKQAFLANLWKEVAKSMKSAEKKGMTPCFRLNLTSDLPWEKIKYNGQNVFAAFPSVQFYDYTKSAERMTSFVNGEMPKNYHLRNQWRNLPRFPSFGWQCRNGFPQVFTDSILRT